MGVMFRMIYMGAHRNNGGDSTALSRAVAEEAGEESVACKVTGSADAVHQFRPGYMGGVDMPVNIHFQCRIHGNNTDAASYFTIIGNFLRTENNLFAVFFNIVIETFQSIRGRGQGCAGNHVDLIFINQIKHAVLDNFRIYGKILEVRIDKSVNNGIGHIAYAGLQGKQVFRKSAVFDFIFQEINEVVSHSFRVIIKRRECTGYVRQITGNDGRNFIRIDRDVACADAISGAGNRNRFTERRIFTHINICHAV